MDLKKPLVEKTTKNKSFKNQLPGNLIMNLILFVVNIFVGLWLVPYLIKYIGIAAYGLVPLAMVLTEYINVITISINGAIFRFLTIEIQQDNWVKANIVFNTAFFTMCLLIIIQIPILGYVTFDLSTIFEVPESLLEDAYYLFAFTFIGYLLSLFSSIYSTSMYAYNRLDLIKMVDLNRVFFRVSTIVILFYFYTPSLKFVGLANLVGAVTSLLYTTRYWKKLTPKLVHNIFDFDLSILKKLTSMGGWLIINQIGFLLFIKVDIFVVNKFFGAVATGEYSAVLQWNVLIRTMASVLSNLIGPMLLISFAKNKMDDVLKFGKLGVRFLSLGVAIMTGLICGMAAPLLSVWLGPEFEKFSTLMIVMLCHLSVNLGVLPLFPINTSLNKVKIPGLVTAGMGVLNLFIAIAFVYYFDVGFIGVAFAGALILTLKNGLFSPWYAAKILNIDKITFFLPLISGVFIFLLTYFITFSINKFYQIEGWRDIGLVGALVGSLSLIVSWFMVLKRNEKEVLLTLVLSNSQKNLGRIFNSK